MIQPPNAITKNSYLICFRDTGNLVSVFPLISVHCTRYMRNSVTTLSVPHAHYMSHSYLVGQKNLTGSLTSTSVFSVNLHFH